MPIPGEQFYWEQAAQYGQTVKEHAFRGSNPALYIPLGHGVRARVGGFSGTAGATTNFQWLHSGVVFVSNKRIVFKGGGDIAIAPFHQILSYDPFPDGLSIIVQAIGTMQIKTGDKCLGRVFLKMVNAPPKDEAAQTLSD